MYQTSELFNGEILKTSRRFKARITTGEKIFQDEILIMTINLGSCGDTAFSFGTVFSSYAEIMLADTGQFLAGQELFIEIGLYLQDNTIEYVPLGYFTASSENISKTQGKISLKAADRFSICQLPYRTRISYPAKIGDVLNDISAQTGIVIATSLNVSGTINKMPSNTTCLDLLGDIAGLLGGFCYVDRAGIVRISPFPSTVTREVLEQITMEHSFEEGVYKVGKISVSVGDDADTVYTDSDGLGNGIAVENPYITQPLFDSLKNKLIGYMYHPGTLSFLGDPRLDATDMISIAIDGETKTVPCMNIVHDFDGGLTTTVTAPGRSASDEQLKGPLQIQVEKARKAAEQAKIKANLAEEVSNQAKQQAENAKSAADEALASASDAQAKANTAVSDVGKVQESVAAIKETVDDAKTAADNAWKAASTAQEDAATAKTSAANAEKNAADAKTAADAADTKSEEAISTAEKAQSDAAEAKTNATKASETAAAAKADATQAQKEIDSLGKNLTTLSNTMKAEYARKTDLTEAEASLTTKISQNAADIETTAKKVSVIDETANNAADLAATAQTKAEAAQTKADQATSEATAAQTKANEASLAAQTAQSNADTAKAAAENAQSVADKAKTDLAEAQKNLATVKGRVDATEGDIAKAQKAVTTAQAAAEKAQSDANAAATKASSAQDVADAAKANASLAQTAANQASAKAEAAQDIANEAKVNASDAQKKAADAVKTASDAKTAANNAAQTASDAQDIANAAKANATAAQTAADDAKKKSDQAAADLVTAKKNLEEVSGRVDSTAEEVEAAKTAVATAQAAADKAKTDAAAAQSTADTAKTNASNAQKAADTAKTAADNAKKAADDAQKAADKAQDDVNALTKRVVNAETSIKQNSEAIALRATKEEVTTAIGDIKVGGRNLLLNSNFLNGTFGWNTEENCKIAVGPSGTLKEKNAYVLIIANTGNGRAYNNSRIDKYHLAKTQYTLQFKYKTDDSSPVTFRVGVADTGYIIGNITAPADNTWRKFTATYTAPMTGSLTIRITSGTGRILIGVPKLEYGNKATDWTPAPEDLQDDATTKANNALASAKTYADAQIKVAADSISQNVSKVQAASIISSQEQFYQSTSPTSLTGGSWSNTQPAWASGKYIWRRTLVTYGNNKTGYTPSETGVCITGNTGATGSTGLKALQPLKSFTGTYTTIGSTASENVTSFNRTPVVGDTFINLDASSNTGTWQVTTVSNGTARFKLLSCVSSKGAKGDPGAAGKGIKSTAVTYQASSSGTTVPTGTWVISVPATNAVNPYLWTRTVITYTDNTKSTSYAVGSTLEGVSVGGRNLISKNNMGKITPISSNSFSGYGYKKGLVSTAIAGQSDVLGLKTSTNYILSFTAWCEANTQLMRVDLYPDTLPEKAFTLNATPTRYVFPIYTTHSDMPKGYLRFYKEQGFTETVYVTDIKLELGNVATDWTPAPEDYLTSDETTGKLTELRQEVNSNIEQTGEAIKSSVYEKVYLKDDVDTLLSSVNTEVEQTKTSWQVTFNQLVKQLNDYSDGSDAAFDEIRKYIRFEDGNILLGNSSSPLILRIRNDRIQFLQNGYEVAYISDQRMYNTTCEIINQLRIADSAWTVETNSNGDTIVSLIGL